MTALLKKEAIELAIPALLMSMFLTLVWHVTFDAQDVLLQPPSIPAYSVFAAAGIGGFCFALLQFYGERSRSAHGYLLHRGASPLRIFGTKVIVGFGATGLLALGPPLVLALMARIGSPLAPMLHYERIAELAWIAAFGAPAYAMGAVVTQLRRGVVAEIFVGVLGASTLALIALISSTSTPDASPALRYVAMQLLIAAGLLALAERLFRRALDPDVALPRPSYRVFSALGVVLFVAPELSVVGLTSSFLVQALHNGYPIVVRRRDSDRVLALKETSDGNVLTCVEVDARGEPVLQGARFSGPAPSRWGGHNVYESLYHPRFDGLRLQNEALHLDDEPERRILNDRWQGLAGWRIRTHDSVVYAYGYVDHAEGILRCFFQPQMSGRGFYDAMGPLNDGEVFSLPEEPPFEMQVRRPDGKRFSAQTIDARVVASSYRPKTLSFFVLDRGDGTFWRVAPLDSTQIIAPAPLPGGDRFVRLEDREIRDINGWVGMQAVIGEHGRYLWDGSTFVARERSSAATDRDASPSHRVVMIDRDPIFTRVEVRNTTDDSIVRAQEYGPRGSGDWSLVVAMHALAFARAPLVNAISFATPADEAISSGLDLNPMLGEPLLFGGRRPWLLLAALVLAGLAVRTVVRRLRARDMDAWTTWSWAIGVAALGLPALWLFLILEPRKSAALRSTHPSVAQPPLIASGERHAALTPNA